MPVPTTFSPWFDRYPQLLEREATAYREAGLEFRLDEELRRRAELIVFKGEVRAAGATHSIEVVYPSGFPHIRPELLCPTAALSRHQNPYLSNLCVIPNEPGAWSGDQTGAFLVQQAIALLDASAAGAAAVAASEVDAAEPKSTYFSYSPGRNFLILDDLPGLVPGSSGTFDFVLAQPSPANLIAVLTRVEDVARGTVWKLSADRVPFATRETFSSPWVYVTGSPPFLKTRRGSPGEYQEYLEWAQGQHESFSFRFNKQHRKRVKAFGILYRDEGPARNEYHDAWLVGADVDDRKALFRPAYWSRTDRFRRTPSMAGLDAKKVLIVGLGALGSPLAVWLARAGVGHLGLVDYDVVDAGPIVRQEFDLSDLGVPKVEAIARRVFRVNPHVRLAPISILLGGANFDPERNKQTRDQVAEFADVAREYDLLISATGVRGVDLVVNEIGAALKVPCLFAWVLNGAWGGRVFRAIPGKACYECFAHAWTQFPEPSSDPSDVPLYARGCGFPTFTGTGFDSGSVAVLAARLAVQTLLSPRDGAYPDHPGNLINWSSRGAEVGAFPQIDHHTVARQGICRTCQRYST